jgi:hypothetical protein
MGLSIALEDEEGMRIDSVEDPTNCLHRLLPSADDLGSRALRYVDWYGDTVFNRRQIEDVLDEFGLLLNKTKCNSEKELINRIISLAKMCRKGPHLYLKFYGD